MFIATGPVGNGCTVTTKLLVTLNAGEPSSVTLMVTVLMLGVWAEVGIQRMAPSGATLTPSGPLSRAKVSVFGGKSKSVAVALAE